MAASVSSCPAPPCFQPTGPFYATASRSTGCSRPKLTLNTESCKPRSLGRGTTGLRLDILSAASPTQRNTFKNTFDAQPQSARSTHSPAEGQQRPTLSFKSPTPSTFWSDPQSATSPSCQSPMSDSCASSPTTSPMSSHLRYASPLFDSPKRRRLEDPSIGNVFKTSNFSLVGAQKHKPVKTLRFCDPLIEVIETKVYTAQHYDLLTDRAEVEQPQTHKLGSQDNAGNTLGLDASLTITAVTAVPTAESTTHNSKHESVDSPYPKTPKAGRSKRNHDWKWTLDPLPQ